MAHLPRLGLDYPGTMSTCKTPGLPEEVARPDGKQLTGWHCYDVCVLHTLAFGWRQQYRLFIGLYVSKKNPAAAATGLLLWLPPVSLQDHKATMAAAKT